jgi:hypothetical protein
MINEEIKFTKQEVDKSIDNAVKLRTIELLSEIEKIYFRKIEHGFFINEKDWEELKRKEGAK